MTKRIASVAALMALLLWTRGALGACAGDCAGDGTVTVSDLIQGVNLALGNPTAGQCAAFDTSGDGHITVSELVAAVANLLNGCPFTGQYSARLDVGDGQTAIIHLQVAPDGQATGTLSVAATSSSGQRAAIHITIPFVSLSGTVDLDTGAYDLHGSFLGPDGEVPIDVSGALPPRIGASGTLQLDIGPDTFTGPVTIGTGAPTPTHTQPLSSPTPTATGTPGTFPTPGPSCANGSLSAVFSNVSGTNSYVDLGAALGLGKLTARLLNPAGSGAFGGSAIPCNLNVGDVVRKIDFAALKAVGSIEVGTPYTLGTGLAQSNVSYLELPTTNPLGARGWKAHGGTLILDAIDGDTAHFRIINAEMVAEPSFSIQQPATGTFTINASGIATNIHAQ